MFQRLILIGSITLVCFGEQSTAEIAEIEGKYTHAQAVVRAWSKWQVLLYERAELLELKRERREKRATAEREAFAKMFEEIDRLRKAGSMGSAPRIANRNGSGDVEATRTKDTPQ